MTVTADGCEGQLWRRNWYGKTDESLGGRRFQDNEKL